MSEPLSRTAVLLTQWHEGDRGALAALLERHLPAVRERIRRRLGPLLRKAGDTDDYMQDAVVEFFEYAPRFVAANDEQLRGLLVRIVENLLRDKHDWYAARRRALARERPLPASTVLGLGTSSKSPSEAAQKSEQEAWVRLGIELLEPPDRELLVLREWDGLSFPELGRRFEVSEDAARMRYNRAFARLTECVGALRRGEIPPFAPGDDLRSEEER